jgi:hypothetical protein
MMATLRKRVANPWQGWRARGSNVLDCDRPYIDEFNAYIERKRLKKCDAIRVRTNLLPEPYFGRFNSPLVLLLLNPGVDKHNQEEALHRSRSFRGALLGAVRSKRGAPHFHLLCGQGPGHQWWSSSCAELLERLEGNHERLANKLLAIEYFPYHSTSFDHRTPRLPSQEFTFQLVRNAIRRDALIVCMRGELEWLGAVPELTKHEKFCVAKGRKVRLSPTSVGLPYFEKIVAAIA